MGTYNVHAGHNADGNIASGAVGILKESIEDRKVKNEVIRLLKQEGHTVYDCTVDNAGSQSANLKQIVDKCNSHNVDLDISIHFNCYNGIAHGVEVLGYNNDTKVIGDRICNKVSKLGFSNRGYKVNPQLYVIKNTKAKAILIECCFIDNKNDTNNYNYKTMAKAIVEGILDKDLDKKYTNCILYGNDIDRVGAEIISWTKDDCIVKNVKDHIAWEGANLFTVGGQAKYELDKMNTKEKYTSIVGSDRYDTIRNCLKFVGQ